MSNSTTPLSERTKAVRLNLTEQHHALLWQLAGKRKMPMSRFVRELVEKEIERRAERENIS